jgi:multidrug efflux system membrane fusion protein
MRLVSASLVLASLALAGCDKPPVPQEAQRSVPVRVATVAFAPRTATLTLSGTVQARTLAELAFRVGGKVVTRPVEVGDHVRAGQVLATLDQADLQLSFEAARSALDSAVADAAKARADFSRYQQLGRESPAFMASEYDHRQSASRMADARVIQAARQLELAKDQLAYATLSADADGVITALPVQVGQVVASGQAVAGLAHTAETEVVVDVPENRLPDVRAAQQIDVALWAEPSHPLKGRVREIGAQADAASRTFAVKVTVLNAPPDLLSLGMTAAVRFVAPPGAPLAILPTTALTDHEGSPAVWVLDPASGHASRRRVTVAGYLGDGSAAIAAGISAGEQVVTAGANDIDPAMRLVAWAGASR